MILKVKKLCKNSKIPIYAYRGDAGMDLFCVKDFKIKPLERINIGVGLILEIPPGYAGLVWDKSGLSVIHGIHILSGVVDAGFRGELHVTLYNTSDKIYKFKAGDKVAQILIQKVEHPTIKVVKKLSLSERGAKTKGSSGR